MKKLAILILSVALMLAVAGCAEEVTVQRTIEDGLKTYYEMSDGTWECDGHSYQYRLEISGRMPNAAVDSRFVYLSNLQTISFERAWRASGFSSHTDDYFSPEQAVLVEWHSVQGEERNAAEPRWDVLRRLPSWRLQ